MPRIRSLGAVLLALGLSAAIAVPAGAVTATGRLQIIQLDVGQGDGAVVISPLGQVVLIDEGGTDTPVMGVSVVNQLKALGIDHVDYHFASHYHSDHVAQIDEIVNSGIPIGYAWDRGGSYSSSYYTTYVSTVGSTRRTMAKNQVVTLDSLSAHPVTIKCVDLNGAGLSTTDENTLSMVLKISYGEFDMTYGGDLGGANSGSYRDVESIVGPEVGPVEVVKVHHHGSATSTNANWLAATQPRAAIISVGDGNSYGHPTSAALTRLHNANVKTYWTETGAGATPNATWDRVANGQVRISATWQGAGVDTIRAGATTETFLNSGTAGDATPPVVALTSPDGGEDWKAGSTHAITWSATDAGGVTAVELAYSTDGGAGFPNTIATGLANAGTYAWTVPNAPGTALRVRARAWDAAGNLGADSSAAVFTVSTWTIAASAGPNGAITPSGPVPVAQGASQAFAITPAAGHHVADVVVDGFSVGAVTSYTFTNVTFDRTIGASFSADAFALTVTTTGGGTVAKSPDQETYAYGTTVTLVARPASGWAFAGWSGDTVAVADSVTIVVDAATSLHAAFVDVAAPVVAVTSPAGGESWLQGSAQTITWSASDNAGVDSVSVDYSLGGPAGPWHALARGLANSGSLAWDVPAAASDSALVRVTAYDAAGNAGADVSDSLFRIVNPSAGVSGGGPAALALARPQPNPGRGSTLFGFALPAAAAVRLEVLDLSGRRVWSSSGAFEAGRHAVRWSGEGDTGRAGPGRYFVRLVTPWGTRTQPLVWLR